MEQDVALKARRFWLPATVMGLLLPIAMQVRADTNVGSDILTTTTWTVAGSPYVITTNVELPRGVTLTIQPGVTVRFDDQTDLTVNGHLMAEGTQTEPILFTATNPAAGAWEGISFMGTETNPNVGSSLKYVTIEYGGDYYADIYLYYARIKVRNSTIRHSSADGIYGDYGGVADLSDVQFSDNAGYAVQFSDGGLDPVLARLTATGNGHDGIALGYGDIVGKNVWEACGLPYILTDNIYVDPNATLYVEPGVTVRVDQLVTLDAYGRILALGTATDPIVFTGTSATPGWWEGISIIGMPTAFNAGSVFKHTTVEYGGGYYANIYVNEGQVAISQSIIRHSSNDGVYLYYAGLSSTVERSQIVDNAGYAIQNENAVDPANVLLAANNWWGDASGPYHATANPSGSGGQVSDGVAFSPFLASPTEDPGPVAPSDARILAIEPKRWFAPADGTSRIWVTITLRDGTGQPLPGRTVNLGSTLGTAVAGGTTNINGETFAYVTSDTPGDARLTAVLQPDAAGEFARSPTATVTFESGTTTDDLLPGAAAPYSNDSIKISPLPVTRGVPTSLSVTLVNPNSFPISVDGTFSIANFGIGLAFGPIGQVSNHVIAANSNGVIGVTWTPIVSGHYCIEFQYSARNVPGLVSKAWDQSGDTSQNVDTAPGPLGSDGEKGALDRAQRATGAINTVSTVTGPETLCPSTMVGQLLDWIYDKARRISRALGGDPPRQDYTVYTVPPKPSIPSFSAGGNLSAARAAAYNDLFDAMLDVITAGRAAEISLDRYAGAAEAGDLLWASQQAAALLYYKKKTGQALTRAADKLQAVLTVAQGESFTDYIVTEAQVRAYQNRLRTTGFTTGEINAAKSLGMTDAEIEAVRRERIAADPTELGGSQLTYVNTLIQAYRDLGNVLANPSNFPSSEGAWLTRAADGNNLARVYETSYQVPLGNPLSTSANIALKVRRIDLPPDWMVDITPTSATLAAGGRTTLTVTVRAGTTAVQGTRPRVGIEAYAGGQMIGGVILDVVIPHQAVFDSRTGTARWRLYR